MWMWVFEVLQLIKIKLAYGEAILAHMYYYLDHYCGGVYVIKDVLWNFKGLKIVGVGQYVLSIQLIFPFSWIDVVMVFPKYRGA